MKVFIAAVLFIAVALSAAEASSNHGDSKPYTLKTESVEKRGLLHSIKGLAKNVKKFTVKTLESIYQVAKKTVSAIVHTKVFEDSVDAVIGLIDTDTTEDECSTTCSAGIVHIPEIGDTLAPAVCPSVCKAALAKLSEAAKLLAEKIES